MAPIAGGRGRAHDFPPRHSPAGVALQPVVEPDRRRARRGVFARKSYYFFRGQSGDLRHLARRILLHALRQSVEADRVLPDVVPAVTALADDYVHEPDPERRIGARKRPE